MNSNENPNISLSVDEVCEFLASPAVYYFAKKLNIHPPQTPIHPLEKTARKLLMKEFDIHRADQTIHPIMKEYGVDALPFSHQELAEWRTRAQGLSTYHGASGMTLRGRIDDLWHTSDNKLILVEYAPIRTSGDTIPVSSIQKTELYGWILTQKGFSVSSTCYLVELKGLSDKVAFDAKIEFSLSLHPHQLSFGWVEPTLLQIQSLLNGPKPDLDLNHPLHQYVLAMIEAMRNDG